MDKAWESGAAATAPTTPNTDIGYPTDGAPGGPAPTIPGAWWFHMLTMELLNTISASGQTPDASDLQQLKKATLGSGNIATKGHWKFGSGLIVNWGRKTSTSNPTSETFDLAFPNAVLGVFTQTRHSTVFFQAVAVWNETTTGFDSYHDVSGYEFFWLAIGH